ncbi:LysR family transcriptional regulator [Vibrio sp. SCSIO 43136]|uniref:LysR family transcriptional regulator n=1 Tax=Vibrio sp. SCSIO 43136 TaxID=2819101 RepID=UPI0020755BA4|nr:LysR family transcriptional regulator [Vibrio sp. SCSIO 43136]USD67428.1 LysR family transcriptional regulator [Vibrio sp. SCSIO 43136]
MDIDGLKGFLAFVETGSFTRAAKQMNRTQSAFSVQMRKLEDELGVNLFEKEGRNLTLTEAGLSLRSYAEQLVSLHSDALKGVSGFQEKRPLRLGCPEDYNEKILPKLIKHLCADNPTYSVQVFSQPSVVLREWLDEGKIDAAIVTRAIDSDEGYWLTSDTGVWIASPDYALDASETLPVVLFQSDCKYHAAAIDGLVKNNYSYKLLACCDTSSAQRALVSSGLAIGALGAISVTDNVRILEQMPPLPSVDIVLIVGARSHPLLDKNSMAELGRVMGEC